MPSPRRAAAAGERPGDEENDPLLARLAGTVQTETPRTLLGSGWFGGAVFIAWPTAETLATIADDRRTKALVVLSWNPSSVQAWAAAAQPEMLTVGSAG